MQNSTNFGGDAKSLSPVNI